MINKLEKNQCCGCYSCVSSCSQNAIYMRCDTEGFWYPDIDEDKCINCNICEEKCPSMNNNKTESKHKSYICLNKDNNIRLKSSSGGVFSAIAEYIIQKNGVVFGAGFDEELNVCHKFVDNTFDLEDLRGSKYVQSKIGDAYKEAEEFLKKGTSVLFVGTPCQIEGLKLCLDKDYENLICSDFICHGVSSPKVWRKFISEKESEFNSKVKEAYFRDKNKGWKKFSMVLKFENGDKYIKNLNRDIMLRGFLGNIYLRPSCYDCNFKIVEKASDLTLGDFWNIDNIYPDMNDDKGISLLVINSKKGEKIFKAISENIISKEVNFEKNVLNIEAFMKSAKVSKNRADFMKDLDDNSLDTIVNKYCKINKLNIIKFLVPRKVKLVIKKILKNK